MQIVWEQHLFWWGKKDKLIQRDRKESHVCSHISSHFHFLSLLSCHTGVLLIALKEKNKTKQRNSNRQSEWIAAHGEDSPACVSYFHKRRSADTDADTNAYWDSSHGLIDTHNFSGISRVFIACYKHTPNRHVHMQDAYSHHSRLKQSPTWISFGKRCVLLSRHASWNFARASHSFAISHLCKPWDQPIWIIQLLH